MVNYPLSLKKWHHGDAMYPTGMKGSKKISQLFKDNKLSLLDKEKIWILADAKRPYYLGNWAQTRSTISSKQNK